MELDMIKTEEEYQSYLERVDSLFDIKTSVDSEEGRELKIALLLIKQYEDEHYPIAYPDPIDAIKLKMEEMGLRNMHFVGKIGSKSYVSALLNRKKPLTLAVAKIFHHELGIPAEVFFA